MAQLSRKHSPTGRKVGQGPLFERRWGTVSQVAELLSVHPQSVYRGISKGQIKAAKVPSIGLRVDMKALMALLAGKKNTN
jgi:excisionase family DNA binding protein